jgi:hypothetical protein
MTHAAISHVQQQNGSPAYEVLKTADVFELRAYPSYLVAEVTVPGPAESASSEGFRLLAGYIFGSNTVAAKLAMTTPVTQRAVSTKLAMTAPVTQVQGANGYVVQFVMPPGYSLSTLPVPNDARVTLREMPAVRMAVLRYSGRWTEANYQSHLATLRAALLRDGVATVGEPVLARYNAPYVLPFLRRNEIWLHVDGA